MTAGRFISYFICVGVFIVFAAFVVGPPDPKPNLKMIPFIIPPNEGLAFHYLDKETAKRRALTIYGVRNGKLQPTTLPEYRVPDRPVYAQRSHWINRSWRRPVPINANNGSIPFYWLLEPNAVERFVFSTATFLANVSLIHFLYFLGGFAIFAYFVFGLHGYIMHGRFSDGILRRGSQLKETFVIFIGVALIFYWFLSHQGKYILNKSEVLSKTNAGLAEYWHSNPGGFAPFPSSYLSNLTDYAAPTLEHLFMVVVVAAFWGLLIYFIAGIVERIPVSFYYLFVPHKMASTITPSGVDGPAMARKMRENPPSSAAQRAASARQAEELRKKMETETEVHKADEELAKAAEELEKAKLRAKAAKTRAKRFGLK